MALDFTDPATTYAMAKNEKGSSGIVDNALSSDKSIKTSGEVSGIELRILPPFVKDNHTTKIYPFPGYSKLYCITIVVSDAVNELAGAIDIKVFPRIGDNEHLPVNKTIFYFQQTSNVKASPNQLHVFCTVIKSKESLRDAGQILSSVKSDSGYTNLVKSLGKLATDASGFGLVTDVVVQVAGLVGKYMGNVEDKAIGTVINSYTTLHGDFDNLGISRMQYPTRDVDFEFEMVVRDSSRKVGTGSSKGFEMMENVIVEMTPL